MTSQYVLVTAVQGLGDFILSLPALTCYASLHNVKFILIASDAGHVSLAKNNPIFAVVINWNEKSGALCNLFNIYKELSKYLFSKMYCVYPSARREKLLSLLSFRHETYAFGSEKYSLVDGVFGVLGKRFLPRPDKNVHHSRANMILLGCGDVADCKCLSNFFFSEEEMLSWRSGLNLLITEDRSGCLIAIHPGAKAVEKCWPIENWIKLAQELGTKYTKARFLVFGGKDEQWRVNAVADGIGNNAHKICGESIRKVAWLIKQCDLFVGNDSALMHIAAVQDMPVVAVFGHTNFRAYGPLGDKSIVVRRNIKCSPCVDVLSRSSFVCRHNYECINTIPVSAVFNAAAFQLSKKSSSWDMLSDNKRYVLDKLPTGGMLVNVAD